jgi:molecular chaperone DnaK
MTTVGFDFGTTNSLISVVANDRVISLLDEDGLPIPSVVCYEGSSTIVGRDAKRKLDSAGLGIHGNVVRSPKFLLGETSAHIGGVDRSPVDVVAEVVAHVRSEAMSTRIDVNLEGLASAVVTIPIDMNGRRRRELREAFSIAGVDVVQFVHEPLAALYGYFRSSGDVGDALRQFDRRRMLVVDWGGGTLDLTLCTFHGPELIQLNNHGSDDVGGDRFDEAIRNVVLDKVYERDGITDDAAVHLDARTRLLHQCETSKIALSDAVAYSLFIDPFFKDGDRDLDYRITVDEMNLAVKPLIDRGMRYINDLLEAAGCAPAQVDLCLAVGGMVSMPAIRSRLNEIFGPARVVVPKNSATLVSEGAAWIAHDRIPLTMARRVEVELARNSFLPIVLPGTLLPRRGETQKFQQHLYCVDPRDATAKIQFCAPQRVGKDVQLTDSRLPLAEVLTVPVDGKAPPFAERIELDMMLDHDLILSCTATSLNTKGRAALEIHDLEFGIRFPSAGELDEDGDAEDPFVTDVRAAPEHGRLRVRSNVSTEPKDMTLVPGDLAHKLDPWYLKRKGTDQQRFEYLYYQPCGQCGRAYSDPDCRCGQIRSVKAGTA